MKSSKFVCPTVILFFDLINIQLYFQSLFYFRKLVKLWYQGLLRICYKLWSMVRSVGMIIICSTKMSKGVAMIST